MAVTMNARWDNSGTIIPGGDAEYVVAEQPIAEYDNWFNYNIVADVQAAIDDVINRFNANTILKADTDNTPTALVVAEQTIVGRKTGNSIAALIDSEVLAIIGVEAGATADQTNTEIRDAVEAAADSNTFTDNDHTKLNGIETAADVTDATNVAAATAVMDADFSAAEGFMRKTGAGAYTVIKSNLGAAVAPTVNEDSGDGYGIGSQWLDTTADNAYICFDASVGAAVWVETGLVAHAPEHITGGSDEIELYDMHQEFVLHNNSTGKTVTAATYTKYKETEIADCPDTLRISFDLGHLLSTTNYGKIYRNGVAVGTERIASAAGGGIYTTYTEDIAGWSDGDLLQVYCYKTGTHDPGVKNLKILGANIVIPKHVENLTSQDP